MARILLIEDNESHARKCSTFLAGLGHEVVTLATGTDVIKRAATELFDLALLDIELPDMDGKQLCMWLKTNPSTRSMPVIMLTASDSVPEKVKGLYSGANDFLTKPYAERELEARIDSCLRTKSLQDELEEANSRLMKALKEVEKLSVTDTLTGLYNRRHFNAVLEKEFNRHKRYHSPVSFMIADIDHFKKINDTYGHNIGDIVIQRVSEVMRDTLRNSDIIARWGGEEFIVFLPETVSAKALEAAQKVRAAVEALEFDIPRDLKVTISIGISSSPEVKIASPDMFVETADKALYAAKQGGRNRVEVFSGTP